MNGRIQYFVLSVCAAVMLGGCGIFSGPSYVPVRQYDLTFPAKCTPGNYKTIVVSFSSEAAARYKMVTRSGVELFLDEYNRWVQPPSVMLTRYLRMALTDDGINSRGKKIPVYELSGVVLAFETDKATSSALLCIRYSITNQKTGAVLRTGLLRYEIPLDKKKALPEAFAAAMSAAAEKTAQDLSSVMKQLAAGK